MCKHYTNKQFKFDFMLTIPVDTELDLAMIVHHDVRFGLATHVVQIDFQNNTMVTVLRAVYLLTVLDDVSLLFSVYFVLFS
jgi:hypothetical protein